MNETVVEGWVFSGNDRGSDDILWSCCVTILLCCWASTIPNVPALTDKWYHRLLDKVHLCVLGLLTPEGISAIAFGELANARRSVKVRREVRQHPVSQLRIAASNSGIR